jgi:hypothetical protein
VRRERRGLTESATEAATTRRKQHANRKGPTTGQAEFRDQRWVLDLIDSGSEKPSEFLFTVAREDVIEVRVD